MNPVNQAIARGIWRFRYLPLLLSTMFLTSISPALVRGQETTGCATPDPFVTLGGGTCVNGGWLPPGMVIPPPPSPPPAPPPPVAGECTTPDPFATLGGGTCVNGGWLPPGMVIPPPPSPPPAPPPPVAGECTTPDPFVTLGGGTCVNGGWLPPGMVIPTSTTLSLTLTQGEALSGPYAGYATGPNGFVCTLREDPTVCPPLHVPVGTSVTIVITLTIATFDAPIFPFRTSGCDARTAKSCTVMMNADRAVTIAIGCETVCAPEPSEPDDRSDAPSGRE